MTSLLRVNIFIYRDASPTLHHSNKLVVGDEEDDFGMVSIRGLHQFLPYVPVAHLACIRHVELKAIIVSVM